ncbi:MAG: DUF1294 domain-containing protein [Firmicutes bacterium HGW-Firmicutes-16]|nr:MAG: DUF1294 domain-containing protein [Firmicutes bacterium HGW-Firmicutes-16]
MITVDIIQHQPINLLWNWLSIINIASCTAMFMDKYRAEHQKWRIPEKTLFTFALLGGSLGGIFGMYAFHHKTRHRKFTVGFPAILIVQIVLGILIYMFI